MGKGDMKTRRGKIFRGTYGNNRPRKRRKNDVYLAHVNRQLRPNDIKSKEVMTKPKNSNDYLRVTRIINKKTGESYLFFKQPEFYETNDPEKVYRDFFVVSQMYLLGVPDEELHDPKKASIESKKAFLEANKRWNDIKQHIEKTAIPDNLFELLVSAKKSEQEKLLRGVVFTPELIAAFIFTACKDHGYKLSRLRHEIPQKGLDVGKLPSAIEVKDTGDVKTIGQTELSKGALKQAVEHSKVILSFFLEKDENWHCFFTTFKSLRGEETWLGEKQPHFHYISKGFGIDKQEVINQLKSDKYKLGNLPHIALHEYGKQPTK